MTPRSLFNIILKIMGIFFFKEILFTIPQLLASIYGLGNSETIRTSIWLFLSSLALAVLYWFVGYFLIFKTEKIIDEFKLDKGFDQEILTINLHRSSILSIAIIVIGGFMIANALPALCSDVYQYYLKKRFYYDSNGDLTDIVLSGSRVVCGIILIGAYRPIVNAIEFDRRKADMKKDVNRQDQSTQL